MEKRGGIKFDVEIGPYCLASIKLWQYLGIFDHAHVIRVYRPRRLYQGQKHRKYGIIIPNVLSDGIWVAISLSDKLQFMTQARSARVINWSLPRSDIVTKIPKRKYVWYLYRTVKEKQKQSQFLSPFIDRNLHSWAPFDTTVISQHVRAFISICLHVPYLAPNKHTKLWHHRARAWPTSKFAQSTCSL